MKKEIFDFSEALRRMKEGKKVKRCGWDSSDSYSMGKNSWGREYIYITEKPHVPVVDISCGNILANDWEEVEKMRKKVLTLTVSKEWFDMIVSGKKTEEYRVIKGYWAKRLLLLRSELEEPFKKMSKDCTKDWDSISVEMAKYCLSSPYYKIVPFTHVLFINGYRKDSPRIEKEIESIAIGKPKKGLCPDKWLDTEFFIIRFNSV